MSFASSAHARRFLRRAAALFVVLALGIAFVLTARESEARETPSWLSRFVRAVAGREAVAPPTSDTTVVFGPKTMSLGSATSATFVEKFVVATPQSGGYVLRITNGPASAGRVTGGSLSLNGAIVFGVTDFAALAAGATRDIPVIVTAADTIVATLTGPVNSAISVSLLTVPDAKFMVYGPRMFERDNGTPVTITENFTLPAGAKPPAFLCIRNGELDGSRRNSSSRVILNGTEIVGPSDLNQQVSGFLRPVTFQQNNVLQVEMKGSPGSRLTICGMATDSLAPRLTITAPTPSLITREAQIDAVGVVVEQTAVKITVNGQLASVTPGTAGQTSFTSRVTLAAEGPNAIAFTAIDAAGNRTDSSRTVIRDTHAPVVTLNSLPDSATVRADSALTVSGTITDLTKVTANVNGQALAIDSVTHAFSQRITLASGMNFVTLTATDAAGNATSVVRQITVDNTPPTLTLTGPAESLITKELVAHVTGTATANTAVSVTVNGVATTLASGGAFATDVAIAEGAGTITVVATNAAGLSVTATRHVVRDTQAPALGWAAPADSVITKLSTIAVSGIITDATTTTLTVNGAAVAVDAATKAYQSTLPLTTDGVASITLVATDAAGNTTTATRTVTRDATAPVITILEPDSGLVTQAATVHVSGSVNDLTKATLTVNGTALVVAGDGGFAGDVAVAAGANTLSFVALDAAGNQTQASRMLTRDNDAPVVTVASPSDQVLVKTATVTVRGTIADASAVTATLNGAPLTIAADRTYQSTIALSEGLNTITLVVTDAAGNATTVSRAVTLDTTAPTLVVSTPADGTTVPDDNITVSGTATDQSVVHVTVNGASALLSGAGAFSTSVALATGSNAITVVATDSAGNSSTVTRSVTKQAAVDPNLPPNPRTVAPALNRTVATTQSAATTFLYTGTNPIQTGVVAGTIVPARVSTLRGRVLNAVGAALPGATVVVLNHPEFGGTKSRADGWYDLVVNGGGKVTLAFNKDGYIGAQRIATAPRQDYGKVEDVLLLKPDTVVTVVQLGAGSGAQIARSSVQTDPDGSRQTAFIFDAGTTATIRLPDGTTQPAPSLSIRLTEFTVGDNGRARMPASLPPASGYTYAVEPTADEAVAVGGQVTFSKPVSAYVENFLEFPVGTKLPLGTYDRTVANWIPQPDGRVIKVLSVSNGIADIDANGDGVADSDATLAAMGFSTAERQQIATSYPAGAQLMRTRLFGLYPFDANLPYKVLGTDPVVTPQPSCVSATRDIIKCDVRVASQAVDIPGTPLTLAYTSARAAGAADRTLHIPVTGSVMPAGLMGAYVHVWVAGQLTEQQYLPAANLSYDYTWDGNDAYGRPVQGNPSVTVEIGHLFPVQYQVPASTAQSFGMACDGTVVNGQTFCGLMPGTAEFTERHSFWRTTTQITKLGGLDAKAQGLGGFDFNVHHQYDPVARVLYLGDGTTRVADAITPVITTVAGRALCAGANSGDGAAATKACLGYPAGAQSVVAMPDGGFLESDNWEVRRVRPDGVIERFAGLNQSPTDFQTGNDRSHNPNGTIVGEGGPATQSYVVSPGVLALAPDGTVYIADGSFPHIVRVAPSGILTRVIGQESGPQAADGMLANVAKIDQIRAMAVGLDGALFFVTRNDPNRIYRLGSDSLLHVIAGTGIGGEIGDGGPARQARVADVTSLAVGVDGSLYLGQDDIYTGSFRRVRRITPDGVIRTVAGGGGQGADQATPALQFGFGTVRSIAVSGDGTVYASNGDQIEQVGVDGIVRRFAGENLFNQGQKANRFGGDGGSAQRAWVNTVTGMSVTSDGAVLIADYLNGRIRKVAATMPGFSGGALVVASRDASQLYSFDASGRHLKTLDMATGKTIYSFAYDASGMLSELHDQDSRTTRIERDPLGNATAIVAPSGIRTVTSIDAVSNLASLTGPDGVPVSYGYGSNGMLLSAFSGGSGINNTFDAAGRVLTSSNPLGGMTSYQSSETTDGSQAISTAATGEVATVVFRRLPSGARSVTSSFTGGGQLTTTDAPEGQRTTTTADGTTITRVELADPQFGLQSPSSQTSVRLPSGLTKSTSYRRGVEGEDPTDIFNIFAQVDSFTTNGRARTLTFDRSTNTVVSRSAEGKQVTFDLDRVGHITDVAVPGRPSATTTYDEVGHLTRLAVGSRTLEYEYDAADRIKTIKDPRGGVTTLSYDSFGRLSRQTVPDGRVFDFGYDLNGKVTSMSRPSGAPYTWTENAAGLLSTFNVGANATPLVAFSYDSSGRPRSITRNGLEAQRTLYSPSSADRTTIGMGADTLRETHHPASQLVSQLSRSSGPTLAFTYDGALPTAVQWAGPVTGTIALAYDSDFRVRREDVGSSSVAFSYDADDLLLQVGSLVVQRDAGNGSAIGTTLGAITTTQRQATTGDLDSLSASFGQNMLYSVALRADAVGRIVGKDERIGSATSTFVFQYDSLGQLSKVTRDGSAVEAYEYDATGNRIRVVTPGGSAVAVYDTQDRLLSQGDIAYSYDALGNIASRVTSGDSSTYRYDGWQQLRAVQLGNGTLVEYVLDGLNRRVGRKVNGAYTHRWLYRSQLGIAAEVDGSGVVQTRFVYGTRNHVPDYMVRTGRTYRLVLDERGSVRLVIDVASGQLAQELDYDGFGRVIRNTNPGFQPFGYAGGIVDDATGLVHFGAREYDPQSARWLTSDPLLLDAGDPNLYRYALGDPINRVDPSGRWSLAETITEMTVGQVMLTAGAAAAATALAVTQSQGNGWEGSLTEVSSPSGSLSPDEKQCNQDQGDEYGCMECLTDDPGIYGKWINNHIPPKSLMNLFGGGKYCIGPHCSTCSSRQGGFIKAFKDWYMRQPNKPTADEIMDFVLEQATRW
jgi:RHS repeat-associated protein